MSQFHKDHLSVLISQAYSNCYHLLTEDCQQALIKAAVNIEKDENLSLIAGRLSRVVTAEIRYFNLGQTAPKELVDLANYLYKTQASNRFWESLTRLFWK